ncbi:type II toxin-antitoxin system VapC family toxin [Aquamicrobium sp. NLF2-7]|uniref:PIN domain-containing protein n=1 Tax=Aquamicrobium sp. NLF2-7 TaxID=2918753 RepID=UPI001EFAEB3B|nr:type II toxin-antitoxin system VapC family toxin [Aquamicrobium sp. NLF2-7]MCG8273942.1 type II toxin-antitoxin system VapC family toxin [Aquamicrobium sp. NLF2-7]
MSACVIDTSAVMAFLNDEIGADQAEQWLDQGAAISGLCVQETMANLVRRDVDRQSAVEVIEALGLEVHPLDFDLAIDAGDLITSTRSKGLSHGDRACLALARKLRLPAVTADTAWSSVAEDVEVEVSLIR